MRDIDHRPVLWTALAIALTVSCVIAAVLAVLHFRGMPAGGARLRFAADAPLEAPGLSSAPQDELARTRPEKERRLNSAGWVDRQAGTAHIPIDAAMDLLVKERGQ
jgi:hypothetical protein